MKSIRYSFALLSLFLAFAFANVARATDVDGPDDCARAHEDFGDAPEAIPAYPSGVLGHFPTCLVPSAPGTRTFVCPPISTPPGPTGYILHVQGIAGYWLGCYPTPTGPMGIDSEPDGKVALGGGPSACGGIPTDCIEPSFPGMSFGQDECYADGSDAGITSPISFAACAVSAVSFFTWSCTPATQQSPRFLNICVDWNGDGDWNDNFSCPNGACAFEWAVKNAPIAIPPGCALLTSPAFLTGPFDTYAWLRISLTDTPVPDDYPWAGSATVPGGNYFGGETEDYPVAVGHATATSRSTWGRVKTLYR